MLNLPVKSIERKDWQITRLYRGCSEIELRGLPAGPGKLCQRLPAPGVWRKHIRRLSRLATIVLPNAETIVLTRTTTATGRIQAHRPPSAEWQTAHFGTQPQPRALPQPHDHAYNNMDAHSNSPRPASSALAGAVLSLLSFSKASPSHPRAFFVVQSNTSHLHTFQGSGMSTSAVGPTTPSRGAGASDTIGEYSGTALLLTTLMRA